MLTVRTDEMAEMVIADRFELLRLAGQGGMATVHEARDRRTGRSAAVKIVSGPFANLRFEREAELLARLEHENIVRYVAHGRIDPTRMFLAMEWLDGEPLDARLERGALDLVDASAICAKLARALATAHAMGIIHRDVKPSNVILRSGSPDDPVLVDFGIARATQADAPASRALTVTGTVIGTPSYMAPEQVRGEKEVDARADVFSLGCVLFECLAGRPPFEGEHTVAVLAKILLEPAPRLRSRRVDAPEALDQLVDEMLAKSRDDRPPSVTRIAEALDEIRAGRPVCTPIAAPASSEPRAKVGIGDGEQRYVTVSLIRPKTTSLAPELADTVAGITMEDGLGASAAAHGVRLMPLADGGYVGVLAVDQRGSDAALRVVRCALALQEQLGNPSIAIASGRAIVAGNVPVGSAIDRAAQILVDGELRICEGTAALVHERFDLVHHATAGSIVLRERAADEQTRTLLGRSTPCVGRERELALLTTTYHECVDEPIARAVLVVAEPGVGKTRLQREVVARLRAGANPPAEWLALGDPITANAPYGLAGAMLRRALGITNEPLEDRRARIEASVKALVPAGSPRGDARATVAPWLGEITGAPFDDSRNDALRAARREPPLLAAQVTEAVTTWALAVLAERPVLLVIEDVHWADVASVRLIGALLAAARELPLMVLALARPTIDEAHPRLWEEHRCERLRLDPLLRKAASQLARAVLGSDADVEALVQRAGGNALFVEELARACAEGRAPGELPPTIAAVTEARLATLPLAVRRVLRAAAVFGERFWPTAVAKLVGSEVDEPLRLLRESEIVSRFDQEQWVFRHALVRDAAYAMLTDDDRRLGHALAAEWLETRVDDGALLGHHYEAGGKPALAARWYARAAEQSLAANDFDNAFRWVERAVALGDAEVRGAAHLVAADAWLWLSNNVEATASGARAVELLPRATEKWFSAIGSAAAASGKAGDTAQLSKVAEALETTAAPSGDLRARRMRTIACARAAIQIAYGGDIARADRLLSDCAAALEDAALAADKGVVAWVLHARFDRGQAVAEPEHPSVAIRGRELSLEIGDRRTAYGQWASEAQLYCSIGAFENAAACAEALVDHVGQRAPSTVYANMIVAFHRSMLAATRGQLDALLEVARAIEPTRNPRLTTALLSIAAQVLLLDGRVEAAKDCAERALAIAGGSGSYRAPARAVLSRVALGCGDEEAALREAEAARAEAASLEPINSVALLAVAHAQALDAHGRVEEARRVIEAGVHAIRRAARHLAEYREPFFAAWENPELVRLAAERGIATD